MQGKTLESWPDPPLIPHSDGQLEALAIMADHLVVVEVWTAHREPRPNRPRRFVALTCHAGSCAVPGCSRQAVHLHHIVFRLDDGSDERPNTVGLCSPYDLHGIHKGFLMVSGRAGERLVSCFATSEAVPLEVWVTEGDDDVRRANVAGNGAGAGDGDGDAGARADTSADARPDGNAAAGVDADVPAHAEAPLGEEVLATT